MIKLTTQQLSLNYLNYNHTQRSYFSIIHVHALIQLQLSEMETSPEAMLLEIEAKLEADIVRINKELLKTRKLCSTALDKINSMIVHIDDTANDRLDSIHVQESAVKRRLYVKLGLLGQKLHTVAAAKKILDEVMIMGIPNYVDSDSESMPPVPGEFSDKKAINSNDNVECDGNHTSPAAAHYSHTS